MRPRHRCLPLLCSVLLVLATSAAAAGSARDLVVTTTQALVQGLRAQRARITRDQAAAYRLADQTVIPHIDFRGAARRVLGQYWRDASEAQRTRFTAEFRTLLRRSYVTAMVNYVEQILAHADNVRYPPSRSREEGNNAVVTMLIRLQGGPEVTVEYRLVLADAQWKIFDVQIEGVSLALTYRSTFVAEIQRRGIDGLIDQLAARNRAAGDARAGGSDRGVH